MDRYKFRVWFELEKKMVNPENLILEYNGEEGFTYAFDKQSEDEQGNYKGTLNFKVMAYTGLKDKNGKEIYEGDIVRWHDIVTADYIVTFIDGVFCLNDRTNENFYHHRYEITTKWEVIGNRFDNPELLEG